MNGHKRVHQDPMIEMLGCWPTLLMTGQWFRENIHAIAHRLKKETTASAAFCSLPPIGEDPTSAVAFQSELNRHRRGVQWNNQGCRSERGCRLYSLL